MKYAAFVIQNILRDFELDVDRVETGLQRKQQSVLRFVRLIVLEHGLASIAPNQGSRSEQRVGRNRGRAFSIFQR